MQKNYINFLSVQATDVSASCMCITTQRKRIVAEKWCVALHQTGMVLSLRRDVIYSKTTKKARQSKRVALVQLESTQRAQTSAKTKISRASFSLGCWDTAAAAASINFTRG